VWATSPFKGETEADSYTIHEPSTRFSVPSGDESVLLFRGQSGVDLLLNTQCGIIIQ
jgi:hypothetical protein